MPENESLEQEWMYTYNTQRLMEKFTIMCKHYILLVLLTQHLVNYQYIAGASVTIVTLWQRRWQR